MKKKNKRSAFLFLPILLSRKKILDCTLLLYCWGWSKYLFIIL